MMDQTDRRLAARFDAIANREDDSDWQAIVQGAIGQDASQRAMSASGSRSQRRIRPAPALVAAVVVLLGAVAAFAAYERFDAGGSATRSAPPPARSPHRSAARPRVSTRTHSTPVTTLVAFRYRENAVAPSDLPASVTELVTQMGADPASAQEPFAGPPSIYLFHRGSNNLCLIVALGHASGSCWYVLTAATGAISDPSIAIVEGKLFVTGLAADDVQTITATLASTSQTPGTTRPAVIKNNVFVASLPYNGGGVGAITITVNQTNGTSQSFTMPGVPAPPP